jgi:hypothetical protein
VPKHSVQSGRSKLTVFSTGPFLTKPLYILFCDAAGMALTQLLPIEMLLSMLNEYKWVILFYAVLIGVIYRFRDKFDWQNKFIGLYRTKFGLQLMERLESISVLSKRSVTSVLLLVISA